MAKRRRFETRCAIDDLGEWVGRVLVRVRREGQERFDFAEYLDPRTDRRAVSLAPAFSGQRCDERIEQRQLEEREHDVPPRFDEADDGAELADGCRSGERV